jgi:hypothetical protein
MTRYANPLVMDAALDYIATANLLCINQAQPATYAEATTGAKFLASVGVTSASFTKAAGSSGRKTTISVCGGTVTTTGSANHMSLVITSSSTLVYVWVLTEQYITAGNTFTAPALYAEIGDPVAP